MKTVNEVLESIVQQYDQYGVVSLNGEKVEAIRDHLATEEAIVRLKSLKAKPCTHYQTFEREFENGYTCVLIYEDGVLSADASIWSEDNTSHTAISGAEFLENVSWNEWADFIYDCVNCEPGDIAIIWDN